MTFVFKRCAAFVVALIVQSAAIFLCLRILPGDLAMVVGGTSSTPEQVARIRQQLGLDQPYPVQYWNWLSGILHGDLGTAQLSGASVAGEIADRLQVTLPLALMGLAVALAIGLPLGVLSVTSRSARVRRGLQIAAIVAGSIPALWGGLLLIMLLGRGVGLLGVLPSQGFPVRGWHAFGRALSSLALPALSVGIITGAEFMRYTRSALLEVRDSDYLAQAMACGMTRAQAVRTVGLRLAAPQIVSVAGLTFAGMLTGVIVVENLFALPGLATLLMDDLGNRDLLAVQSELLVLTAFFLFMGLVVDLVHHALDPRLKAAASGGADGADGADGVADGADGTDGAQKEGTR